MARGTRGGRGKPNAGDKHPYIMRGRGGRGLGNRGRGGPMFSGVPGGSFMEEELDFTIQMYADSSNPQESSSDFTPRGRGRRGGRGGGRGHTPRGNTPNLKGNGRGSFDSSRGNGTPRGRGRGDFPGYSPSRGRGLGASAEPTPSKLGTNSTLSDLLFASRPFLKPVKFVQSTQTPFLFTYEEEIMKPVAEEIGNDDASHVPTADQVERIFHGTDNPFGDPSSSSSESGEEIEEIDFNNMDKLLSSPKQDDAATKRKIKVDSVVRMIEAQGKLDFYQRKSTPQSDNLATPPSSITTDMTIPMETQPTAINTRASPTLVMDTQPQPAPTALEFPRQAAPPDDDDEVIVYVAPHPRVRVASRAANLTADNIPDKSEFKPYNPPATLALAAMSIREEDSALSQPRKQEEQKPQPLSPPVPPLHPTAPLPIPTVENLKFGFSSSKEASRSSTPGRKKPAVMTPRVAKKLSVWEGRAHERERRKKKGRKGHFAAFGALLSEARLNDDVFSDRDSKWQRRRRDDSDVEWGTESEDAEVIPREKSEKAKGKEKEVETGGGDEDHGMEVDDEIDIAAMKRFVGGLIGREAGAYTTMDDVEVEERIKAEGEEPGNATEASSHDGEESGRGSDEDEDGEDDELERVLGLEEKLLLGESSDGEEEDESEDDHDYSPKSSFQARLEKLRAKSLQKKHAIGPRDEDDDDDVFKLNMAWAEEDDDYDDIDEHIQNLLEQRALDDALKKGRHSHFRAVQDGEFVAMQLATKRKDKGKDLPEELKVIWERDRQKKAERKRERELEKLIKAADPLTKKKGGKKGRKAMLAAARLDPTIDVVPNRIIDITTLVQQIRRFIADIGGPNTMSLPPTNKETRKNVHELALAFALKSQSKGKGNARYTTLFKTTKTSASWVDERKVAKILRRAGGAGARGETFGEFDGGKRALRVPKHREGEEVGASAPKIDEGNLGFKMLSAMGWTQGDRIGLSGGLEVPLVAIIKHSKLGLGAIKQ